MGVPLVIHFRLGFSMTKTIQRGVPHYGNRRGGHVETVGPSIEFRGTENFGSREAGTGTLSTPKGPGRVVFFCFPNKLSSELQKWSQTS